MKQIVFLVFFLLSQLSAKEYFLHLNKGWQLIGLPTDIGNMRIFNNDNVRLIWAYENEYNEWVGYSPESSIRRRLENAQVNTLNSAKHWQGLWVFSKNDWDLEIDDSPELDYNYPKIDVVKLSKGWNLISLPFNSVFSAKILDGYKVWRYGEFDNKFKSSWQTNQQYTRLDFPEVDEINGKSGLWVYSPENREIDLSLKGSEFLTTKEPTEITRSKFQSLDEVSEFIKKSLFVSNRNNQYWNWTPRNIDLVKTDIKTKAKVSNSITNGNLPNIKDDINKPTNFKVSGSRVYYISGDKKSVLTEHLDNLLFHRQEPVKFTPAFTFGDYYIKNFLIESDKLIIILDLQVDKVNPSFEDRCRAKKIVVSIYELNFNNISKSIQKYLFIDGDLDSARVIDSNLYIFTKFKPCIQLDYEKNYLGESDRCNYPPFDTIDYQTTCYDIEVDSINKKRFRYNYKNPTIKNAFMLPKYISGKKEFNLVKAERFFTSAKMDKNSSIFSISHIDLISGKIDSTSSIFADINNIYYANKHIYLTSESLPEHLSFWETRAKTDIYEFSYYPKIEYLASGNIQGQVLNKFSINEIDDSLQIASTDKYSWNESKHQNRLTVFQTREEKITEIANLDNIVNESYSLAGIKFYGNIAIASTDSNNQPLQLIDLSNPKSPVKGGTLDIAGTSEFIYFSESEKRVFSIGREITETFVESGIELNIIDIDNIHKPKIATKKIFGDYFNFTPIFENSQAFSYAKNSKIMTIPIYKYGGESSTTQFSGIYFQEIKTNDSGVASVSNYNLLPVIKTPTADKYHKDIQTTFLDVNNRTYVLYLVQGKLNVKRIK